MKSEKKVNRKWEDEMRRKGDMERHVKKETGHKNLHKKKNPLYPDKHNFNPDEAKED